MKTYASSAIKTVTWKELSGTKVAIDANLCMYQFLSAVRLSGGAGPLVNSKGDTTR